MDRVAAALRSLARAFRAAFFTLFLLAAPAAAQCGDGIAWRDVTVVLTPWHAGIVIDGRDFISPLLPPALRTVRYLEFGWGHREYYRSADPSLLLGLGALLGSSPAVLHVAGFDAPPKEFFPAAQVRVISFDREAYTRLIAALGGAFSGAAEPIGGGLYGSAYFFEAQGEFSASHTCNTWVAEMLHAAGCDIPSPLPVRSSVLLRRIVPLARPN